MTRLLNHVKRQAVGYVALFVALGGTGYAAVNLPRNSVGSRQLRNGSVSASKLASPIAGYVRDYARINSNGQIIESSPVAKVVVWRTGSFQPGGAIEWTRGVPTACVTLATAGFGVPAGTAAAASAYTDGSKHGGITYVALSAPQQEVTVMVVCPRS